MAQGSREEEAFEEDIDDRPVIWRSCTAVIDAAIKHMCLGDLLQSNSFSLFESMCVCCCRRSRAERDTLSHAGIHPSRLAPCAGQRSRSWTNRWTRE